MTGSAPNLRNHTAHLCKPEVLLCLVALFHCSHFCTSARAADECVILQLPPGQVERWSQLTFEIKTDLDGEHPPESTGAGNVEVIAVDPLGEKIVLPAFTAQVADPSALWYCRFTPQETGKYTAYARLNGDEKKSSSPVMFSVTERARKKGFLHSERNTPFFMQFDNSELFRGIGINLGWEPRRRRNAEHTYDVLLPKLSNQGVNTVRTWMCPWNMPMEWAGELGRYNPDSLKRLDELLLLAEQNGIYLILVLGYHGELQTTSGSFPGNDRWKENPYNFQNGGPCKSPEEFFTNEEAIALYKQRLRHLVARIASHPHLLAWEFWNEVDHIQNRGPVSGGAIVEWHKEMVEYLHAIDPYNHPVTTSISVKAPDGLWEIDGIDLVMLHPYGETDGLFERLTVTNRKYGKPSVASEFSYSWRGTDPEHAKEFEREFHLGLWRGMMSPTPIMPLTWWWEFHDSQGDWHHFGPLAKYSTCMTGLNSTNWNTVRTTPSSDSLESYCIRINNSLFVWVLNNSDSIVADSKILISDVPSDYYEMRLFDTLTGEFREQARVELEESNSASSLRLPALQPRQDVALVLEM